MSTYFLALQSTPTSLEIGLFHHHEMLSSQSIDKMIASKDFLLTLETVLAAAQKKITDCSFIVVNQGPGYFTTLRTTITYANGLGFALHIPLIGINGMDASYHQYAADPQTVFLLDACAQDIYYAYSIDDALQTGYKNIEVLLRDLQQLWPHGTITCMGQGALVHQQKIATILGPQGIIPESNPAQCSLDYLARCGYSVYVKASDFAKATPDTRACQQTTNFVYQLEPLYFKRHPMDTGITV